MTRPQQTALRPQMALQSYLDGLLQEATETFEAPLDKPVVEMLPELSVEAAAPDEFQAAVLEEQVRDARREQAPAPQVAAFAEPSPVLLPSILPVADPVVAVVDSEVVAEASIPVLVDVEKSIPVEPLAEVHRPAVPNGPLLPATPDGRPAWAAEPFECLLFDVAGLTLAVPLVCLGSIYPLAGQDLTPLFGQPDWFLGILTCQAGNLKVLDTARWVMPDRYREDFRQGLQYVISVQGYEWGLAVHQVSRSLRLDPDEIKWRSQRGQRPWLAGTVIEHMCALLDVAELAELIASGAVKQMHVKHQ
ncbi:chemotaxis protein CheW [Pseudomonas capeferrum]|uniref:CheW domain-containing protein n=1 Tax=Pseudomonas capeferrum TaxID=1495066 RepID=UPI0015E2D67E|nr:CheW domain-containing protein [Pseudomonas capeferrum]MBA1200869.1 chemotaxis protein CheW [Pseudomonas capeferrum]